MNSISLANKVLHGRAHMRQSETNQAFPFPSQNSHLALCLYQHSCMQAFTRLSHMVVSVVLIFALAFIAWQLLSTEYISLTLMSFGQEVQCGVTGPIPKT
jgi:hypothetical protein